MNQIFLAFITGLTSGGLSCLAVQGSLLASSMANQIEADIKEHGRQKQTARPIILFLAAKLVAYTLLGFLLGWLGSMFQLSPIAKAILMAAIGVFMILQALRLLNIHPFFQRFTIETPYFIRKWIRSTGKTDSWFTPVLMGLLTIFIPCGITQAMMAAAMAAGMPMFGAALMFSFILGTSPVFFAVAYFATKLGSKLESWFNKLVAVVLVVLAVMNIQSAFNLAGLGGRAPVSVSQSATLPTMQPTPDLPLAASAGTSSYQEVGIEIQNHGYFPEQVHVAAGQPIHLTLTSEDVYSCALAFVIPSLNVEMSLQPSDSQTVDLPALQSGQVIPFSCSMGMYTGQIVVD